MHLFINLGGRPRDPHYFFYCSVAERQAEKLLIPIFGLILPKIEFQSIVSVSDAQVKFKFTIH